MTIHAADFETTSYKDYEEDGFTRAYLWCIKDIDKPKVTNGDTIEEFIAYLTLLEENSTIYFHNLAFDGCFILDYLLKKNWSVGSKPFQFESVISSKGPWYSITLHYPGTDIVIKDSHKKFPMSLQMLANTFGIPGKTELDFDKRRDPDYIANRSEIIRCSQDVKILSHALKETFNQGMDSDTASSDAFRYFMRTLVPKRQEKDDEYQRKAFQRLFPKLLISKTDTQFNNLVEIEKKLRKGYYGGLTYVNPIYQDKIIKNVSVYDRNSMYPAVMINHPMPYGRIKNREPGPDDLYVIEIETKFKLKEGHLPFIQNKNGIYRDADVMTESDDYMRLVLPSPMYELFHENYEVEEEVLNQWTFASKYGIFDQHIKHFMNIKANTKDPGERMLAKLRLNGLYGKFGQDLDRINKTPILKDNKISFIHEKGKPSNTLTYLPVSIFTTAWAKYDLIKAAEQFGDRFVYCDTDSIHVIHQDGDEKLLPLDPKKLGYWKYENTFELGKYVRPKMYSHGYTDNQGNQIITEVKAAGLPENARSQITFENLTYESEFEGKLIRKIVPGGCVLVPTTYKIKGGVKRKSTNSVVSFFDLHLDCYSLPDL